MYILKEIVKEKNPIGENVIRGIFNKYKELYNLKETSDE